MTGEGFSFLNIPRSYYGRLVPADMAKAGVSEPLAKAVYDALVTAGKVSITGIVE